MAEVTYDLENGDKVVVQLRDPRWAALLAWLWPGAGHFYQRRFAKGFLFMICVLSTFFFGLGVGRGRVVYASMRPNDFRWQYFCQIGTGLPAFPALAQAMATQDGGDPMFVMCERYPHVPEHSPARILEYAIIPPSELKSFQGRTIKDGFMAPPAGPISMNDNDVLGMWHVELRHWFEIGTLYTMIAGLLNMLAIYDAFAGPVIITPEMRRKMQEKKKKKKE
jgi:hypothetical protein